MAHALDRQRGMAVRLASSATGDLANNVDRLRHELQQSKYAGNINARAWRQGDPADLLPLIHFALLGYSKHVHDALAAKGYDLFAKTDVRFLEVVYKLLRQEFGYQPQLRVEQFFAEGFAERKVILAHDILKLCQRYHSDLQRELRLAQARATASRGSASPPSFVARAQHARPLVEKGAGFARAQAAAAASLRGSGGSRPPSAVGGLHQHPRHNSASVAAVDADGAGTDAWSDHEEDEQTLQPRAMHPPAPHPAVFVQGGHSTSQGGAIAFEGFAIMDLRKKVEELSSRLDDMQAHVASAAAVERRCAEMEHEYSARLLLSEGRIRFLEESIRNLQSNQDTTGPARATWPVPGAHSDGPVTDSASSHMPAGGAQQDQARQQPVSPPRSSAQIGAGSPPRPLSSFPTVATVSEGGDGAAAARGGDAAAGDLADPKLNLFISSIRERFRETHALLEESGRR